MNKLNPTDTHAETVGYVNRKIGIIYPKANLNIICSQGIQRKERKYQVKTNDIYKIFSCRCSIPTDVCL